MSTIAERVAAGAAFLDEHDPGWWCADADPAIDLVALDLLDAIAEDPAFHLEIDFQPGDVQLVNNHVLFHDRTAFEDWAEPERRRHLRRLRLAPLEAQALPAVFAERFGSVTPGARGGVTVPRERWSAPLDAA